MPFALEQLSQGLSIAAVVSPQTLNNSNANSGNGIDMSKFRRAIAVVLVGSVTAGGSLTAKLQAATTSGGSFSDVANSTITAITASTKEASIEIRDDEMPAGTQFLRVVLTEGGSQNVVCAAVLLGGEGDFKPASKQDIASVAQRLVV
jgi:hypothetical protein